MSDEVGSKVFRLRTVLLLLAALIWHAPARLIAWVRS